MKFDLQPRNTIKAFAEQHDLTIIIRERPEFLWNNGRFTASFEGADEKGDGVLIGTYGNGNSHEEAIRDYAKKISSKTLVFGAYTPDRKEIRVPIIEPEAE